MEPNPATATFDPATLTGCLPKPPPNVAGAAVAGHRAGQCGFRVEIDLADLWFDVNASGTPRMAKDARHAGPVLLGWQWISAIRRPPPR